MLISTTAIQKGSGTDRYKNEKARGKDNDK